MFKRDFSKPLKYDGYKKIKKNIFRKFALLTMMSAY